MKYKFHVSGFSALSCVSENKILALKNIISKMNAYLLDDMVLSSYGFSDVKRMDISYQMVNFKHSGKYIITIREFVPFDDSCLGVSPEWNR